MVDSVVLDCSGRREQKTAVGNVVRSPVEVGVWPAVGDRKESAAVGLEGSLMLDRRRVCRVGVPGRQNSHYTPTQPNPTPSFHLPESSPAGPR